MDVEEIIQTYVVIVMCRGDVVFRCPGGEITNLYRQLRYIKCMYHVASLVMYNRCISVFYNKSPNKNVKYLNSYNIR